MIFTASCKGEEFCGPLSNSIDDPDGDCVPTSSDNCPVNINPGQIDVDDDGLGNVCDENDNDESCGPKKSTSDGDCSTTESISALPNLILNPTNSNDNPYPIPEGSRKIENAEIHFNEENDYVIGCTGEIIGNLASLINQDTSLLNPYFRPTALCSALNSEALYPPAIFNGSGFVAYLTLNPDLQPSLNTCELFDQLGLENSLCEN